MKYLMKMKFSGLLALACVAAQAVAGAAFIAGKPGMLIQASDQKRELLQDLVSQSKPESVHRDPT